MKTPFWAEVVETPGIPVLFPTLTSPPARTSPRGEDRVGVRT